MIQSMTAHHEESCVDNDSAVSTVFPFKSFSLGAMSDECVEINLVRVRLNSLKATVFNVHKCTVLLAVFR